MDDIVRVEYEYNGNTYKKDAYYGTLSDTKKKNNSEDVIIAKYDVKNPRYNNPVRFEFKDKEQVPEEAYFLFVLGSWGFLEEYNATIIDQEPLCTKRNS